MLPTGPDHLGKHRTAVCCLSSLNLDTFLDWQEHPTFVEDVMRFLDNVLTDFIERAPVEFERAAYARDARAQRRPRRDGISLFPSKSKRSVRKCDGQGLEPQNIFQH